MTSRFGVASNRVRMGRPADRFVSSRTSAYHALQQCAAMGGVMCDGDIE